MFTLVIAATKGGVGKTTLAAALCTAAQISDPGTNVGLIDLDPQGSLTRWWNERALPDPDLVAMPDTPLGEVKCTVLAAGMELLVLDCPPGFPSILRSAIEVADLVLIPTGPSELDLAAIAATADMARQAGKPYCYVLNRATFRSRLAGSAVMALRAEGEMLMPTVHQRVAIAASMSSGRTALETEPTSAAARELGALWVAVSAALNTTLSQAVPMVGRSL